MGKVYLIVGGRRSGKSDFALKFGETFAGPHGFVATCPFIDVEMEQRIRKHQEQRDTSIWSTIEEEIHLASIIKQNWQVNLFLIDCVTLWINNQIFQANERGQVFLEDDLIREVNSLLNVCAEIKADVIFVSNETGLGVVPDNPETRYFLDLLGRCNQIMAARSEEVFMVSCGIPIKIKKGNSS